jgi:hypothetical protein
MKKLAFALVGTLSFSGALSGCFSPTAQLPTVTYTLSTAFHPKVAELADGMGRPRVLAALRRVGGRPTDFSVNEVILCPDSEASLNAFMTRTAAIIVSQDGAAPAPEGVVSRLSTEDRQTKCYTLRLDANAQDLAGFEDAVAQMMTASQVEGATEDFDMEISSESGAKLLALVAREAAQGVRISPNWIGYGSDAPRILNRTSEHIADSAGTSFRDSFAVDRFRGDATGSFSRVTQAWQWMAQRGFEGTVRVGIIDSGFGIEERTARPYQRNISDGNSDFRVDTNPTGRGVPLQFDHTEGDSVAEGPSKMRCTGGSECPWHGLGSAQTAAGWADNEFGVAGTGGHIAVPILQMVSGDLAQWKGGVNTALDWGAQVISISMGFGCDNIFCEIGIDAIDFWGPFERAQSLGVPVIASAGNDSTDVDGSQNYPCGMRDVICVGALDDGMLTPIDYSNWGATRVDIWAPTNIPVREPEGNRGSFITMDNFHSGTSAAAPFVAGVVAMMKSIDPSLNPAEIQAILQTTATGPTTDARMTGAINALDAVMMVSGPIGLDDTYEPNDSPAAATRINIETPSALVMTDLRLSARSPRDYYRFTLTDWAVVSIFLDYPKGMAVPQISLRKVDGGIPPHLSDGPVVESNGIRVSYDNAAPGEYVVSVALSSTSPADEMLYGLRFQRGGRPSAIAYDSWEYNDGFAQSAVIEPRGTFAPTLHRMSRDDLYDVDYFRVTPPAGQELFIQFNNSDMPVTLSLMVGGDWGASGFGSTMTLEPGQLLTLPPTTQSYFLIWQSPTRAIGRYSFAMMPRTPATPGAFDPPPSHGGFWNIDPSWIFVDLSVIHEAEHFLLPPNLGDVDILGRGPVMLELFDLSGNLIEAGVATPDPQGGSSTRIHWSRAPRGQQQVLRAMRLPGVELEGSMGEWPSAPFNLFFISSSVPEMVP